MTDRRDMSHTGLERAPRAAAADLDLAPPHAPGQPRQLGRGRLDELDARTSRAQPLTELEEAVLIAVTGCTGLTMPDRPFADPRNGKPIMAKPNLNMAGRTAGSPDNAQGTHFFLINDTGTYFLRKLPPPEDGGARCSTRRRCSPAPPRPRCKLLDHRIDVPDGNRDFPAYLDSNRFLSNLPGHDDPVPGRRPVAAVHQRDDVPADPARGRAADDRRRPQLLPAWPA